MTLSARKYTFGIECTMHSCNRMYLRSIACSQAHSVHYQRPHNHTPETRMNETILISVRHVMMYTDLRSVSAYESVYAQMSAWRNQH